MNQTASIAMLAWPVVSLLFFAALGPWRGVIATYLGGYLLLSGRVVIPMSGIPDYTKYTAANLAALAGILIFDASRLASFRFRRYDLPALALLLTPAISFALNGLDSWQGVSATATIATNWVIPYFVGRLYVDLPGADRQLALGLTLAGALMAPLIAYEVFAARSISELVYGIRLYNGYKHGFYRAIVMANNGLELGICATLLALPSFALWTTRTVSKFLGLPLIVWMAAAMAGAVLCMETAALGFLGLGMFLIAITAGKRRYGSTPEALGVLGALLVMPKVGLRVALTMLTAVGSARYLRDHRPGLLLKLVVLSTPVYLVLRATKLFSRKALTMPVYGILGYERAESLDYRFVKEDITLNHIMNRPLFGWATFAGGRARAEGAPILDSMWIIHTAQFGFVGLAALYGMLCLAAYMASRQRPAETWTDPKNAAAVGLIVCLSVYIFDSLLNAYSLMFTPMLAGFLMGLPAAMGAASSGLQRREAAADRQLEQVDRLAVSGRAGEAEALCRRLVAVRSADPSGHGPLADASDRLADLLEGLGREEEAEPVRREALGLRIALASSDPAEPAYREALAGCAERLARNLIRRGLPSEAVPIRGMALEQRAALAASRPDDPTALARYADGLNDLAWLLSVGADPATADPGRAVSMAEQAVRLRPDCKSYWNTLGAAYLRSGEPGQALGALRQSVRIGPDELGFDEVLRALALAALGDLDGAREAMGKADAAIGDGRGVPGSLRRLRAEASEAVGGGEPAAVR